jgi:hypothetical protein
LSSPIARWLAAAAMACAIAVSLFVLPLLAALLWFHAIDIIDRWMQKGYIRILCLTT